jgi:tetratricopeptide (TPR) repeat protein
MLLARGECFDAAEEFREAGRGDFRAREAGDLLFEATLGYGRQLVDLLQFREARRVLSEAVAMKPSHPLVPRASLDLARAHRRMEEPAEAEAVLRSCAGRFPSFGPAWVELGDLCREGERLEEAAAFAEKGIRADPGFDRGYLLRAEVRTLQGRFDEAEADFAEHGKRFPPTGESELLRGVLHLRRGEPGKALERLRRALSLEPGRIRALYLVSLCHRDLGEEEAAREAMERWRRAEEAARAHARARAEEGAATVIGNARKRAAAGKGPEGEGPGKEGKGDARGE